jgi:hypothetical protein
VDETEGKVVDDDEKERADEWPVGGGRGPRGRRAVKVDLFDAVS